jgi:hypothetical protein
MICSESKSMDVQLMTAAHNAAGLVIYCTKFKSPLIERDGYVGLIPSLISDFLLDIQL